MSDKEPGLDAAYALETPEDSRRLYARWAQTYDHDFAQAMDYQLPRAVARTYAEVGAARGPVLDVGAGTGLLVQDAAMWRGLAVDALDISPEMLAIAGKRGVYRALIQGDLTGTLAMDGGSYGAILSSGTFTHGHVGPGAIDELMRIAQPGAVFVLGINEAHYEAQGFAAKLAALAPQIRDLDLRRVSIYGAGADAAHRDDHAKIAVFRKV